MKHYLQHNCFSDIISVPEVIMENIDWNVYFKGDNKDYDTKYLRTY